MFDFLRRAAAVCTALALMLSSAYAQTADVLDVLLIGVDTSDSGKAGRSDTMMLARFDPAGGQVRLVSFLRDLYVAVPGYGRTRLNAAYFYGGEELLKETLEKNFGVTVDRTATVHFSVLEEIVNELGGVEIDVTEAERNHLNKQLEKAGQTDGMIESAGLQRLNGAQALSYSRIRKIDSDFQRTSRQQTVITAMLREISGLDRWSLFKLAVQSISRVETDVSLRDLSTFVPIIARLGDLSIKTAHVPFEGTYTDETINGMMVLVPNFESNKAKLQAFLAE